MRRANSGHVGGDRYDVTDGGSDTTTTTSSSSAQIATNYYQQQQHQQQQQYGAHWQYPSSSAAAATTTPGGGGGYSYPYSYPYPYQYPYSNNQQQPPPPSQPSSWPHSLQQQGQNNVTPYNLNGSMEDMPSVSHNHQMNQTSSNFQKPLEPNYVPPEKCEAQQMTLYSQGPNLQSSSTDQVTGSSHYYQQYGQWPYYYNPSAPTVSCPPGAENTIVTSASSQTIPVQATSSGYPYPSNQPPPPGTSLWNGTSLPPSFQGQNNMTTYNLNGSVEGVPPVSHNLQINQTSSNFQKPLESNPLPPEKYEAQQTRLYSQGQTLQPSSTDQVPGNSDYYQQYSQWSYYYNSSAPTVSCPPGAENTLATSASMHSMPTQATSSSYQYPSNQPPPPPGTTLWTGSSLPPSFQGQNTAYNLNGSWENVPPVSRNHQVNQISSNFQKPLELNPVPSEKCEAQEMKLYSQGPNLQPSATTNQVPEIFQSPFQTATMSDTRRVSKMQIPTNPRIASSLALGMSKVDKESSTASAALQPAYISVPVPKPSNKVSSHDDADAIMKGTFPTSLRGYVERTFARCKDDSQRSANQQIMKEVITKASADGSLFTRNWDIEPLFPLPNSSSNAANQNNVQSAVTVSMLPKYKRSPSKRTKSRWEPVAEETFVGKLASVSHASSNVLSSDQLKGAEKVVDSVKNESKNNGWSGIKFLPAHHQTPFSKIAHRPKKKPRFSDPTDVSQNGDASSDSDKEQGLTKYYSNAIALANSPEEKKRREDRSKRFKKGQERSAEIKPYKPKVSGGGDIYTRRGRATLLATSFEDSCSRAVEDIDWDALTVKGTCQEVEKRYLRLTSAPDPSTVRPEEVLMKALGMVQTSQKNYLYKCDQLKSIRQDLTVQRIQNELTVKVYETHARLALEAGDLPEYNQCQSQLKMLYGEGIRGCHTEFSAYNLLCVILHSNNKRDLLSAMRRLSSEAKEDEAVKHALAVRSAVSSGNYILFFRLYKDAPNLNTCLMDLCVEKMRFGAIQCIAKSCRPTVPVAYIAQSLGFSRIEQRANSDSKDLNRLDECEEWLKAHGATLTVDNNGELQLDTKTSSSNLYMPESDAAVAHGDASLAVNDFLTRTPS